MEESYEYDPQRIVYFGATDSRNKKIPFGIRAIDRMRHMYVIGKTGMGKSTMLENLAIQDIQNGEGLCFIDPHGSTAEKLLEFVPEHRIEDVVYFAPFDTEYPLGFNVMEDVGYDKRHLVVAGLMSSFQRIWVDAWSARMEYILQNTLLALLEYPDTTLIDVNRMLVNKDFRKKVVEYVRDPIVKRFWAEEFAGYTDRYTQEATPAIQNKIGQFASNPLVRNIIAQPKSSFDIRELMDTQKIFIVNLSKGRMGEQNADLLGSMIVTKMYLSAMSRAEETPAALGKLPPFYLYVDEFQSVVNDSFANILSESRKYKLALTIAHQYIEQVEEHIRAAVFGNAGTIVTFRVGPFDAETLKTVFEPTFYAEDLVNLGAYQIYLTLMIDGIGSKPFSATTLPAVENPPYSFVQEVIESSRKHYSKSRASVEKLIRDVDEKLPEGGFDTPAEKRKKQKQKVSQYKKPNNRSPQQAKPQENRSPKEQTQQQQGGKPVEHKQPVRQENVSQKPAVKANQQKNVAHEAAAKKIHTDVAAPDRNALRDALKSIEKERSNVAQQGSPKKDTFTQRGKEVDPPKGKHQSKTPDNRKEHETPKKESPEAAEQSPKEVPRDVLETLLKTDE